jgi:SET domain-containing protein
MSLSKVEVTRTGRRVVRRKSRIKGAGFGVYACEPINKNTRIVDYDGEIISPSKSDWRERRYQAKGMIWCFTVNRRKVRDANVGGNIARFINHACKPNCYSEVVGDTIWIRAGRNIRKGEELTYDYNTGGEAGIQCRCRPGCTNKI